MGFTTGASDDVNELIQVTDGDTVTVTYTDAVPAGSRTDTATWEQNMTGTATFDLPTYASTNDTALITVTDMDLNLDGGANETTSAGVTSTTDGVGITMTLR